MPILTLKSENQIKSNILSTLISGLGLTDTTPGSVLDVLSQAIAQSDFAIMYQISQLSRLVDLDAMTRGELDSKAFEFGLVRKAAQSAIGLITIQRAASFIKAATTFSGASTAPIVGNTFIDVNDASNALFSTSGTLVLGRDTNNEEEVSYVTAPMDNTSFWRFTITTPLVNNHLITETVILKQGSNELIVSGTVVRVIGNNILPEIQFTLDSDVILLSGEEELKNVVVSASAIGLDSNIPTGAITGDSAFPTTPFVGARATNSINFSSGADLEVDDDLRDRIRIAGDTLTRGVKNAILNAVVGVVDPDSAKRVVSASIVLPLSEVGDVKVYIDDGTGFEPSFTDRAFESVRTSVTGGEVRLQLDNFPLQKASVENTIEETYDFSTSNLTLTFQVGTVQETINFVDSDFVSPSIATAEEVVVSINTKSTSVEARTSQFGRNVLITAKADTNENIQVIGGTANGVLSFPTTSVETLRLYKDDVKLSKDGATAFLDSGNSGPYDMLAVGAFPHTLVVVLDGKTSTQTATLTTGDVSNQNAVTTLEMVTVLNRDISGMVATSINNNTKVRLTSNTKLSASSKVKVNSGNLNDAVNGMNFSTVEVEGINGDFTLNRELGIVELNTPLTINQAITSGSLFTRGKIRAVTPELYTGNNGETLIISVDGGPDQTITLDGSFSGGLPASAAATFINLTLIGAVAIVRQIGIVNFLELQTNTYATTGSIEVKSASTGNAGFLFPVDTSNSSITPNKAFRVSQNAQPYLFDEDDSLVVTVDEDTLAGAFAISMSFASVVSSGSSTTVFEASTIKDTFSILNELVDYFCAFTSGANTTSATVSSITDQTGDVFRYNFTAVPPNFADFAVNDLASFTDMSDTENNGKFLIIAKGAQSIDVSNTVGLGAVSQTGTAVLSQKRQITAYNQLTGGITVGSAFANTPSISDPVIVLPSTIINLTAYLNNLKVTPISVLGVVEGVDDNTKLQISSKLNGSEGAIQIATGSANNKFNFATTLLRGAFGYNYWTGLLKLVHKVIYGEDADLVAFPGVGAAGILFRILAPTVKQIIVSVNVTLVEGAVTSALENELKSVIAGYVNSRGVGEDIILERIRAAVINVTGVIDVTISTPLVNISTSDNEIIRVNDSDILIG